MISFENVAKVYDAKSRPALDAVTLDIARGEFVFLVGASGSGKSTLLQLVLREQRPTRGKVLVAGKDIAKLPTWKVPHLRRQMGAVFQDFRLLPNKTVHENVAFALQVIGKSRSHINETVPEVLEMVGLSDKHRRMPHELSGGEQQRVAIARAIANRPVLLLADEPTGNLDPTTSLGIMRVLDRIQRGGTTVVMATHDDVFVNAMRKRVIELSEGRIVRDEDFGEYTTTHIPVVRLTPPEEQIADEIAAEEALVDAQSRAGSGDPAGDDSQTSQPAGDADGWVPQAPAGVEDEPDDEPTPDPTPAEAAPAPEAVSAPEAAPAPEAEVDRLAAFVEEQAPQHRESDTTNLARHLSDRLRRSTEESQAPGQAVAAPDGTPAQESGPGPSTPSLARHARPGSKPDEEPEPRQMAEPDEAEIVERVRSRRAERARRAQRSGLFRRR